MSKITAWSEENVSLTTLQNIQYQPSNGIDIIDRSNLTTAVQSNGTIRLVFFTPGRSMTVSNFTVGCNTGATDTGGTTVRKLGLFTVSGTSVTCVARSANDTALGTSSNTIYTKAFTSEAGYSSSYTLIAGTTYAVGWLFYNTGGTFAGPTMATSPATTSAVALLTPYYVAGVSGQTDITNTPITISAGGIGPYVRLT